MPKRDDIEIEQEDEEDYDMYASDEEDEEVGEYFDD